MATRAASPAMSLRTGAIDPLAERDVLQEELSGLEFDRRTEKIDEGDYQELLDGKARRAGAMLHEIEGSEVRHNDSAESDQTANSVILHLDAEAEILIARAKIRLARWQCPQCQRSMAAGDAFCASCATPRPSG